MTDRKHRLSLSEIAARDECADAFAELLEQQGLASPSPSFKEEVLKKAQNPVIQTERALYTTSKKMQLFLYSLRVSAAVIGALALLVLSSGLVQRYPAGMLPAEKFRHEADAEASWGEPLAAGSQKFQQLVQKFSGQFLTMEGFNYDK